MRREGGLGDLGGLFASVIRMSCSDFIYLTSENKPTRPPKPPLIRLDFARNTLQG